MEQGGTRREWETDLDFGGHLGGGKKKKQHQSVHCVVGVDDTHKVVMFWLGLALASPSCLRSA